MDPNNYSAHWMSEYLWPLTGSLMKPSQHLEKAVDLSGRAPGALGFLGMAYGLAEHNDEANRS